MQNIVKQYQENNILHDIWNKGETIALITNNKCVIELLNPFAEKNLGYSSEETLIECGPFS